MDNLKQIRIERLRLRPDARTVDEVGVISLMESIRDRGLMFPIRVRWMYEAEHFEVISGAHRLEACKRLGWTEIEAEEVDSDDLDAKLEMLDENLCRSELSTVDRILYIGQRQEIYEQMNPGARAGAVRARGMRKAAGQDVGEDHAPTFAADTAAKTNLSERTVQVDGKRYRDLGLELFQRIRDTPLATGAFVDELLKQPSSARSMYIHDALANLNRRRRGPRTNPLLAAWAKAKQADVAEFFSEVAPDFDYELHMSAQYLKPSQKPQNT